MYTPRRFRIDDRERLVGFMRHYSFCTLITVGEAEPVISHVPVLVDVDGSDITLSGHVARANPHGAALAGGSTIAIFHGPHSYISPQWYTDTREVPTWNYTAVHAAGTAEVVTDNAQVSELVDRMADFYESQYGAAWDRQLPDDYRTVQLQHIVCFRLPVTNLTGKFKLGQNRSDADQERMLAGLESGSHPDSRGLAGFIRRLRRHD
ncbi:MAG: FMN-binding negative transcriptional regulator [Gammaproteobacteria bacterium]|nr:FMN-binding negative transcriptional regulator [Gammaproteobacteria bacterium]